MTVTVNLRPEIEAALGRLAAAQGISVEQLVSRLLEDQIGGHPPLSPAERAELWLEGVRGLPSTPPLSDEAISRGSIYQERG